MRLLNTSLSRLVLGVLAAHLAFSMLVSEAAAAPVLIDDSAALLGAQPPNGSIDFSPDVTARQQAIALVNNERAKRNLAPLTENSTLDASAQSYAEVLTDDGCFNHSCGPVSDFTTRDTQAGYGPWAWLGENIAAGQSTPEAVVAAWMESPIHRDNILRPEFTEVGLGVAHGGLHGTYWAQEFGAPPVESRDPEG
jgi:uncharacterized protein YkwD